MPRGGFAQADWMGHATISLVPAPDWQFQLLGVRRPRTGRRATARARCTRELPGKIRAIGDGRSHPAEGCA